MLTIFTVPKPFEGHSNVIQRNALKSWSLLSPEYEIILFGNEKGTAEICAEFGFRHIPELERNEFGSPLLSSAFNKAHEVAKNKFIVSLTGDIILMSDFKEAADKIIKEYNGRDFLMVGGRHDLDIKEEIDFSNSKWEEELKERIKTEGEASRPSAIDYFVYPKDLIKNFPPFIIGVFGWDSWLVYKMRASEVSVIDTSKVVTVVHQNHPRPRRVGGNSKEELKRNYKLAGGFLNMMTLREAEFILTKNGLEKPKFPRIIFSKLAFFYPWRFLLLIKREVNYLIG